MNAETARLLERVIDLETRIAFIERTLIEMSDALADARRDSTRDRARIDRALSDLGEMRGMMPADSQDEPPPPHY